MREVLLPSLGVEFVFVGNGAGMTWMAHLALILWFIAVDRVSMFDSIDMPVVLLLEIAC